MNTIASTLTPEQEEHLPYNYLNWHADYSARLLKRSYDNHIGHPLEDYLIPGKMPLRKFNFSKWRAYNAYTKYCDAHPEFVQEVKEELWA